MRAMFLIICWLVAAIECISAIGPAGLEGSYLIRARYIEDVPEALAILRRFIARGPNEAKCERYAVLLNSLTSSKVDQFSIAELGLASLDSVRQRFRRIDVESLRQLYIDAINKFKGDHFDQSMLEIMDCLSQKFRTIDAKARSFLNNKALQELISQYKSIMEQPLEFLLDPDYKHPSLKREQVDPEIRQTLLNLFNGDSDEVDSRFNSVSNQPLVARSSVSPTPPPAAAAPAASAVAEATIEAPAQVVAQAGTPGDSVGSDDAANQVTGTATVQDESQDAGAIPLEELNLTSDEQEYLADFLQSIHKLYDTLPLSSQLNDRCEAYAKLTQAEPTALKANTVDNIVQAINEKIASTGPTQQVYLPDRLVRENFLFGLRALGREKLGDEIWIDLVDCVSQWELEDPEVAQFMKSAELAKTYEDISREIESLEQANNEATNEAGRE